MADDSEEDYKVKVEEDSPRKSMEQQPVLFEGEEATALRIQPPEPWQLIYDYNVNRHYYWHPISEERRKSMEQQPVSFEGEEATALRMKPPEPWQLVYDYTV